MRHIVDFIFEIASLKRVRRSSYQTLGSGGETVAEHSFVSTIIGYCLAVLEKVDVVKVIKMCLFHDLAETRVGDANFVHKRYQVLLEKEAIQDITEKIPSSLRKEITDLVSEFESGKTREARVAQEADKLEQLFQEKFFLEQGNSQAKDWLKYSLKQLKLPLAKKIGQRVIKTKISDWWLELHQRSPLKAQK